MTKTHQLVLRLHPRRQLSRATTKRPTAVTRRLSVCPYCGSKSTQKDTHKTEPPPKPQYYGTTATVSAPGAWLGF